MDIVCLDLEGVLIPEIWIAVAERSGIEGLRLTTRDIADYDELMQHRLALLERHGLVFADIERIIEHMEVLAGAREFLDALRERFQVVILSDTFYEFGRPFMRQLGWPLLLCHRLAIDETGRIRGYRLRQPDAKRRAVEAFQGLAYRVIAAGDSYNDTGMLTAADAGFLFRAPERVRAAFPQLPHVDAFDALLAALRAAGSGD